MVKLIKLKRILNMADEKPCKNSPFCLSLIASFSLCLSLLQILPSPPATWIVPGCSPGAEGCYPQSRQGAGQATGAAGGSASPGHQAPPWAQKFPQFQAGWLGYKCSSPL